MVMWQTIKISGVHSFLFVISTVLIHRPQYFLIVPEYCYRSLWKTKVFRQLHFVAVVFLCPSALIFSHF